jgi:aspartyl/asparaginyl beta-hydroxylase (cupin superfamily)
MGKDWRERLREQGARRFARWFLLKRVGKVAFRAVDDFLGRQSLVGDPPVFDPADFAWVKELETGAGAVRRELEALLVDRDRLPTLHEIQPDQGKISYDQAWKTFVLWGFGHRSERNCARCPETTRLLEGLPRLTSAWFSILAPGKHIPKHSGVTKGMVRCHLGLIVPREEERCRMQVADRMCHWEEGRCLLFDDSCKHEVWNDTDQERVVLIIDVERPMRWRGRLVSRLLQRLLRWSPFVRDALRNQRAWEERVYGRADHASPTALAAP